MSLGACVINCSVIIATPVWSCIIHTNMYVRDNYVVHLVCYIYIPKLIMYDYINLNVYVTDKFLIFVLIAGYIFVY